MEEKRAKTIKSAMEFILVAILWAFGGALARQAYDQGDIAITGIVVGVLVWMTYGTIKREKKRYVVPMEEPYERYCAQIVNGQMIEYPTIVRLQTFKSIPTAMEWAQKREKNQSYRVIDLADGAVIVVNGARIERKLHEKDYVRPPIPQY
jgi:hypothetical protein